MGPIPENGKNVETVLVTGFGPFGRHKINASYEAVKLLPNLNVEEELGVQLVTLEIPVIYQTVQETVPQLWKAYKPKLVIHVGVGSCTGQINLEVRAFNRGYCKEDITGCIPKEGCCRDGCPDSIETGIDVRKVCQEMNDSFCDAVACVSHDPGRYLCDFTYYTSLDIDHSRVVFIHVPELNKPFSALQLAELLKMAMKFMLKSLREADQNKFQ